MNSLKAIDKPEVLDRFSDKLLAMIAATPPDSRQRARLLDIAASFAWHRVRGTKRQSWKIDTAALTMTITEIHAAMDIHKDRYTLVEPLAVLAVALRGLLATNSTAEASK